MGHDDLQLKFRQYLHAGEFRAGDRLETELTLARRFAVPRGAMREVIMHFCHLGVLERVKNRGTFVSELSGEQLEADLMLRFELAGGSYEELKEARLVLETAIMPLVARRLAPAGIEALRTNIDRMAALRETPEAADALDRDFHLLLLDQSQNPTLKLFAQVILRLFRRQFRVRFQTPEAVDRTEVEHRAILAALVAGDADEARRILTAHITRT